jgi:prephenate dehydrogenase/chorismate mutase/prephenate dehydrogenase
MNSGGSAVRTHAASTPTQTLSRRVTVVGGKGLMGRFFVQQFSKAGHRVNILERDNWHQAQQLLEGVDLVLVCVPIEYTSDVIRDIAVYLSPETAMADITSIKEPIVESMLAHHGGPVMGLHPMFGPNVNSFQSQTIAVCPGRDDAAFEWLLELIEQAGGKLTVCTPAEHDQMMLTIQGVRQFATFSLGVFLAGEEIDLERSLELSSPSYRELIGMVNRLFAQSPELVADIMLFNQERRETIVRLAETYSRLAQLVTENDRAGLVREFRSAQQVWAGMNP